MLGATGGACKSINVRPNVLMISRSRPVLPTFCETFANDCLIRMVDQLSILDLIKDSKLTFESHIRSVFVSASRRIGILRKARSVFRDHSVVCRRVKTCVAPLCVKFFVIVFRSRLQLHLGQSQAIIVKWMSKLSSY